MKEWNPANVIRLIAMLGAFIGFIIGVVMIWQGVSAEGTLDIKSSLLSGSLKTGSAGLFISFFCFLIIIIVLMSLSNRPNADVDGGVATGKSKRLGKALTYILIACVITGGLASFGFGDGFGALSFGLGFMFFFGSIAYLTFLDAEQ